MLDPKDIYVEINKEILKASQQTRVYNSMYIAGLTEAKRIVERMAESCRISTEEMR